jgi:hypothetical protein
MGSGAGTILSLGPIEVHVGCVSVRPSELDYLVCARLGQVGSQVNAHATKLGKVIALVGILTSVVLQPVFRRELLLLTLEIR